MNDSVLESFALLKFLDSLECGDGTYRYSGQAAQGTPLATAFAILARALAGDRRHAGIERSLNTLRRHWQESDLDMKRIVKLPRAQRYVEIQLLSYLWAIFVELDQDFSSLPHLEVTVAHWEELRTTSRLSDMWFHSNEWMAFAALAASTENADLIQGMCSDISSLANENGLVGTGTLDDQIYGFAHFGPMFEFTGQEWPGKAALAETLKMRHSRGKTMSEDAGMCEELDAVQIYSSFLGGVPKEYKRTLQGLLSKSQSKNGGGIPYFFKDSFKSRLKRVARQMLGKRNRHYNNDHSMPFDPYLPDVWGCYGALSLLNLIQTSNVQSLENVPVWGYRKRLCVCEPETAPVISESNG